MIRTIVILITPIINNTEFLFFEGLQMNNINFILSLLCILRFFWANGRIPNFTQNKNGKFLQVLFLSLIIILQVFFFTTKIFILYIIFELSIIPIFSIITGWGYQVERLGASLRLIFYTLTASLPLLLNFLWILNSWSCFRLNLMFKTSTINFSNISYLIFFSIVIAFIVKLPIFGVHIWLPKAHVEAPVFGSIILAAILLKLGSYGIWWILLFIHSLNKINFFLSIRIMGRLIISIICLRLRDLKIIIAYSSVAHIGLILCALLINNFLGYRGGLILMLAHGIRSSAIFLISFYLYQRNYSRRLLLTKGVLIWSNSIPIFWFLILITNIAAPPSFNLLSEILIIRSLALSNNANIGVLLLVVLSRTAYSLIMYSSRVQGKSIITNNSAQIKLLELINLLNHILWALAITLSVTMINF